MTYRVLMVCTGNICRSTMAHQLLDEAVRGAGLDVEVDSAGISDEEHGRGIDRRAARVLRDAGHDVPGHRARQIQPSELGRWDLILAMTSHHLSVVRRLAQRSGIEDRHDMHIGDPQVSDLRKYTCFDPVYDLGAQDVLTDREAASTPDVPDPWYGDHQDFLDTLETLERTTPGIVDYIRRVVEAHSEASSTR